MPSLLQQPWQVSALHAAGGGGQPVRQRRAARVKRTSGRIGENKAQRSPKLKARTLAVRHANADPGCYLAAMRWLLLLVVFAMPIAASAKCRPLNRCGCDYQPQWAALVRFDATADGGTQAVVETTSAVGVQDGGPDLRQWDGLGSVGTQSIVTEHGDAFPVDADGGLRCEAAKFEAATWPAALTSRSCVPMLENAGVVDRPCRDVVGFPGCGCSATGAVLPGLALVLLSLRRRSKR
jgi:hypothetical protein